MKVTYYDYITIRSAIDKLVFPWMSYPLSKLGHNIYGLILPDGFEREPSPLFVQGSNHGLINDVFHVKVTSNYPLLPDSPYLGTPTFSWSGIGGGYPESRLMNKISYSSDPYGTFQVHIWVTANEYYTDAAGHEIAPGTLLDEYILNGDVATGTCSGICRMLATWIGLDAWDTHQISQVPFSISLYTKEMDVKYPNLSGQWWYSYLKQLGTYVHPDGIESELYRKCMESVQFNSNMLENCKDAVELGKGLLTHPIQTLIKEVGADATSLVKALSANWMKYRYEFTTTKLDVQEFVDFLDRNNLDWHNLLNVAGMYHTIRSGVSYGDSRMNFSMRLNQKTYHSYLYTAGRLGQLCDDFTINLMRWGFSPSAANLWDLVPLSFVVDWVIPIGDVLGQLSFEDYKAYFNITDCCLSTKTISTVTDNGFTYIISYYKRDGVDVPSFEYFSSNPSTRTTIKRVMDGVAMLIG